MFSTTDVQRPRSTPARTRGLLSKFKKAHSRKSSTRDKTTRMAAIPVEQSELETWREAHKNLMDAVIVAREAVDAAKAQRRYWMEEICANLSPEGRLTQNSLWRQRVTPKKAAPKKKASKPPTTSKRKKSDDTLTDEEAPATNKKSKQPPPPTDNTAKADNHNSDSEEGGTTPIHNQWGNTHQGNPMMVSSSPCVVVVDEVVLTKDIFSAWNSPIPTWVLSRCLRHSQWEELLI